LSDRARAAPEAHAELTEYTARSVDVIPGVDPQTQDNRENERKNKHHPTHNSRGGINALQDKADKPVGTGDVHNRPEVHQSHFMSHYKTPHIINTLSSCNRFIFPLGLL
jgi:hypothetical protein